MIIVENFLVWHVPSFIVLFTWSMSVAFQEKVASLKFKCSCMCYKVYNGLIVSIQSWLFNVFLMLIESFVLDLLVNFDI